MTDSKMRTVKLSDARKDLDALIKAASEGERIVLEKDGATVAAMLPADEYARFLQMDAKRDELFKALDRSREAFKDIPEEEIEREIEKALKEVRQEMAAERKAKSSAA